MKISKIAIALIVLSIWAIFSIGYIGINTWNQFKAVKMSQAAQQGYAQAIMEVGAAVEKCQEVPLNLGNNKTVSIVSVECLKQAQAQAQVPAAGANVQKPAAPAPKK
jgi:hypothetical protein